MAQVLEYDIVGLSESLELLPNELLVNLLSVLQLDEEAGREPFSSCGRTRKEYWRVFEEVSKAQRPLYPDRIPGTQCLEVQLFPIAGRVV